MVMIWKSTKLHGPIETHSTSNLINFGQREKMKVEPMQTHKQKMEKQKSGMENESNIYE